MKWALTLGVLVASACNAIYGLDATSPIGVVDDRDADGVADADDNCPDVANATQDDGDDDGLGDACDRCDACGPCEVEPTNHDEDGDHIADGCDNCPVIPNPSQTNTNGDALGDACDLGDGAMHTRALFDGFAELDASWSAVAGTWNATDDAAAPDAGVAPFGFRLTRYLTQIPAGSSFSYELGIRLPVPVEGDTTQVGIELVKDASGLGAWSCKLQYTSDDGWQLVHGGFTPVTLSGEVRLRLHPGATATSHLCTLVEPNVTAENLGTPAAEPLAPSLFTNVPAAFTYAEVIE